jgi:alpha-N-arabinofuranosidase
VQRGTRDVRVAYDEWNVWFRNHDNELAERYNLSDALAVATFLNIFVRNADAVKVANLAQMVNVIAPMVTEGDELLLQTIFHPIRLLAEHTLPVALDVLVDGCATLDYQEPDLAKQWPHRIADLGPFALLDVAASRDEERSRLTLSVVNRSADTPVEATIELTDAAARGEAVVHVVTGDAPNIVNTFAEPENIVAVTSREPVAGASLTHTFPPLSHSVIELELA